MNAPELSIKAAVSVSEMCEMCSISRSRWYEMVASGIFPKPVHLPSMNRPVYDRTLQEKCLQIKQTGIGLNGAPVLFNRKLKKAGQPRQKPQRPLKDERPNIRSFEPIIEAIKGLGLTTTPQVVSDAVAVLYPTGIEGLDLGDVIRNVFLHLQCPKK